MTEQLEPGPAAAAVWLGIAFGIIPIYGLQSVVALALATLFGLNRPLTFAATFINNPLLQPLLLAGSLQLGHLATRGTWVSLSLAALAARPLSEHLVALLVGSLILSVDPGWRCRGDRLRVPRAAFRSTPVSASGDATSTAAFAPWAGTREASFAGRRGSTASSACCSRRTWAPARRWTSGAVTARPSRWWRSATRTARSIGCDLDAGRVAAASQALAGLDIHLATSDVRTFPLPAAGLILIIDVLQYLGPAEQASLLRRCAAALSPGGRLIFRLPDTSHRPLAWATRLLDRLLLGLGGFGARPAYQPPEVYVGLLAEAGMSVDVRRYRNWLPLAHTVFRARKAAGQAMTDRLLGSDRLAHSATTRRGAPGAWARSPCCFSPTRGTCSCERTSAISWGPRRPPAGRCGSSSGSSATGTASSSSSRPAARASWMPSGWRRRRIDSSTR